MCKMQWQLVLGFILAIDSASGLANPANLTTVAENNLVKNHRIAIAKNAKPQRKPDIKTPIAPPDKNTKPGAGSKVSKTPSTPPDSNTKPGGGLDPYKSCKRTNKLLTFLAPRQNHRVTTSPYPTFWFYIPYGAEDIKNGEFVLVTQDEKTLIYKASFQLPKTPGIVNISLPESANYALNEGKFYHWYLRIYCQTNTNNRADLAVDGWVQKVAATAETERLINAGAPDIWYDSLTRLGNLLLASPTDKKLRRDWNKLLESIGEKELSQEPLAGPVVVNKD
ncbi:MAG: DUF928 domain-containing protein [Microcoleus sp. PH2017_10_PVI_O_A]|uniref:DUF928 domain-containing protein n=1 Tax=unclassified Microcoleus TaxID=2642155 RepID=UPI001D3D6D0E|nr:MULTISPECIES: DUF928 domain-containing protein [unclassified Microcoleus]TAE77265.1 MAG: DUF928 domain-containing protein [Oscillatoriales cyanobacterium]MCC3409115.1 DUF928 domain-containing protein [Microcoleus sp. PH2017_10_PVI_O_A]MCC3463251.1 DUF928 domain-containing protein [Microcoleus sp. PH2017_11_PCY_U_A]MCC3481672.1 DUF928 domain-containing protein [Microcoleus sp. PH2017_12_PCY_D_A]MCC3531602.1 DUF928 domain-containing protein [Microcoleus sp. PH2017_21_RUC_O_A]